MRERCNSGAHVSISATDLPDADSVRDDPRFEEILAQIKPAV
jgi:hypothetical protein